LVSGTDPKSTLFRYPKSGSEEQDKKKTKIQKTDLLMGTKVSEHYL